MPAIRVVVDGNHEETGRSVGADRLPTIHTTRDWTVDVLEKGMQSGASSLMVLIPAEVDGVEALLAVETSVQCWMSASSIIAAHCREEVERPGWAILSDGAKDLLRPRYAEGIRRAIPSATPEQAEEAASMLLDALSADAPPEWFEQP